MRIAIVTETFLPSTDGVVTRLTKAIDYMSKQGHEILIIAPEVDGIPSHYQTARIIAAPAHTFAFYSQRPWALPSRHVKKWLADFKPDIVHAVNPISLAASGVHYAKQLGYPLIASFHTNVPYYLAHYKLTFLKPALWQYLRKLHNTAQQNLVTSQAMYHLLDSQGIANIDILPVGVDTVNRHPKFEDKTMREKLTGNQPENKLLIFVGRLAPEKEIEYLKPLLETRDDISLAIVGDGPEKENLEAVFAGTNTVFTGFLHGKELSQAYASADAFVFPSTSETLGLVITESMASGTPVIAANSEPTAEQIKHLDNGLIFQKEDLDSLIHCINQLDNETIRHKLRRNGRQHAEALSWDNASKAMLDAYYETIELTNMRSSTAN